MYRARVPASASSPKGPQALKSTTAKSATTRLQATKSKGRSSKKPLVQPVAKQANVESPKGADTNSVLTSDDIISQLPLPRAALASSKVFVSYKNVYYI